MAVAALPPSVDAAFWARIARMVQALQRQGAHASVTIIVQAGVPVRVRVEQSWLPGDLPDVK